MWKFCKVLYTIVILWCCLIRVNGYPYTDVDSSTLSDSDTTSSPLNVVSDAQNETKVKSPNSFLSLNINARTINFNIPSTAPSLNIKEIEHEIHKAPIKEVRSDYTLTEGIGYHKLHKSKLTWNEARKACMAENAQLAVINSAEEDELLRELIRVNTEVDREYRAFIGVHDLFKEGDWVTVTGESLNSTGYNVWAPEEPNVFYGLNKNCVTLDKNRGMNNKFCNLRYYYICEIPLWLEE